MRSARSTASSESVLAPPPDSRGRRLPGRGQRIDARVGPTVARGRDAVGHAQLRRHGATGRGPRNRPFLARAFGNSCFRYLAEVAPRPTHQSLLTIWEFGNVCIGRVLGRGHWLVLGRGAGFVGGADEWGQFAG